MSILNNVKSNKGWWATGALVGLLAIGGTATAQGFGRGHGGGFPLMRVLRHLDLTEAQEVQAVRMRRALREQRKAARKEMEAAIDKAKAELAKSNPDPQVLHAAVDEAAAQMQKGLHMAVDQFLELHKTFTPEQRERMVKVMDRVKERRQKRRERFRGDK